MDLNTMRDACLSTERYVGQVTPEQYGLPTPCSEWDVRALLNHMLGAIVLGHALFADTAPAVIMGPGGLPEGDLVGDDPLKAYRVATEGLLSAASGGALDRPHQTPLGEMPGAVLGGFITLDILVHGWDVAKATGQDPTLEPDLADEVLAFANGFFTDETRAPRIGPEIPVPADAPATARLVGFLGRTP
jgi:uncharacterized protein (TIGR03086 family)